MTQKIVLFDICGTIFKSNTTFDFLSYLFFNNRIFFLYKKIYKSIIWKSFNKFVRMTFKKDITRIIALRFLSGYTEEDLVTKVESFYKDFLLPRKNNEIISCINDFQNKESVRVILLSATIDVVAKVIAKHLDCKEYYSTLLDYKNGICTGKIKRDLLGKKDRVISELGIANQISSFYTDDLSDMPVLEMADFKNVILYPKYKTNWLKIVEERGWEANFIEV